MKVKKIILGFLSALALCSTSFAGSDWSLFSLNNRTNGQVFDVSAGMGVCTVTIAGVISADSINYSSTNSTYASVNAGLLTVTTSATIAAISSAGTIGGNALSSSTTVSGASVTFGQGVIQTNLGVAGTASANALISTTKLVSATFANSGGQTNGGVFVTGQASTTGGVTAATLGISGAAGANSLTVTTKITAATASVTGGSTNGGVFAAGGVSTTGSLTTATTAQSITNAQILTLNTRYIVLSAATASTNTLAAPVAAGDTVTLIQGSTNIIVIAAGGIITGTNATSLAITPGANQTLYGQTTTNWLRLGAGWTP